MAASKKSSRKIVVAGDTAVVWLQWPVSGARSTDISGTSSSTGSDAGSVTSSAANAGTSSASTPNWRLQQQSQLAPVPGGSALLGSWLKTLLGPAVSVPEIDLKSAKPSDARVQTLFSLDKFPAKKTHGGSGVYRVSQDFGYIVPVDGIGVRQQATPGDNPDADVVILDDVGNGFRDSRPTWPAAIRQKGKQPLLIMNMCRPLMSGKLWNHVIKSHRDNLVLVIDINDLREEGMDVSRRLSWERTARDLVWQLAVNRDWAQLAGCKNLVVRLGLDGAVHYSVGAGGARTVLYYDPERSEDGFVQEVDGQMTGFDSAFTAALAERVTARGTAGIGDGIRNGILASRRLLLSGFGGGGDEPGYPGKQIFRPSPEDFPIASVPVPAVGAGDTADPDFWTILEEITRGRIEDNVLDFVVAGRNRRFDVVPQGRFGKLVTLDRAEIESFHSIRNLISGYIEEENPPRPLSVAVFGPPGSGKSFSVTQVANSVAPGVVTKLEFNLSQLDSSSEMARIMHQVRDVVLEGRVPLVFFDEFDSGLDGEALGWLKYFLEPMQSGLFREGDGMHPVGKAIFVFAGGTCSNLDEFSRSGGTPEEQRQFKNAKGPDFISRLKGYVDILGVNPLDEHDTLCLARRAILLRLLLVQKAPQLFDSTGRLRIDPGVLRALIKIPEYRHGARSLEAILDMSQLAGRRTFEQSVLPPSRQLELHVDANQFSRLIARDMLFGGVREHLARTIHAELAAKLRKQGEKPEDRPAMHPWDSLPEFLKESFRSQADHFPAYLKAMGFGFVPATTDRPVPISFSSRQVERSGRLAHEQWVEDMHAAGWKYGPTPDEASRTHPLIREWDRLPAAEKKKYTDEVRAIPHYLADVGFEVYPLKG